MSNRVIVEKPTGKEKQKAPYKRQQLFFVHLLCIFFAVRAGIGDDCSLGSVNECSGVRVCVWGKGVVDKPPVPSDAGKKEKKTDKTKFGFLEVSAPPRNHRPRRLRT